MGSAAPWGQARPLAEDRQCQRARTACSKRQARRWTVTASRHTNDAPTPGAAAAQGLRRPSFPQSSCLLWQRWATSAALPAAQCGHHASKSECFNLCRARCPSDGLGWNGALGWLSPDRFRHLAGHQIPLQAWAHYTLDGHIVRLMMFDAHSG